MAKANNNKQQIVAGDAPKTLKDSMFYGIKLDEQQKEFRDAIWNPDKLIVFANARAGTGKTLIAVATANLLVQYGRYDGIVYIVSPVQESKSGYLPGTADEKTRVYAEPLYDALHKININPHTAVNQESIMNQKEGSGYIDCLSHLWLRGCNLENKVIIIDESQNMYLFAKVYFYFSTFRGILQTKKAYLLSFLKGFARNLMKTSFACVSRKTRFSLVKKKLLCYNRIKPFKKGYIALLLLLFAAIKRRGA